MVGNMKKVLVLGATGAMGVPLIEILSKEKDTEVYATSRRTHTDDVIHWLQGNAHDVRFLQELLKTRFDAIVDFMVYSAEEFRDRYKLFLNSTNQYVFISSARVYAPTEGIISETSPRILDVCDDQAYIQQELYDISKALQENMLINSGYHNYTIIRPSLTYNDDRLQFALYEKEEWLYRVLQNQCIVFPKNMETVRTTMTWGGDVAVLISKILFNAQAYGEVFNVTCGLSMTWKEILNVYASVIEKDTGIEVKVFSDVDATTVARKLGRYYQYIYARGIDRVVSNKKISGIVGNVDYRSIEVGLSQCMHNCLSQPSKNYNPPFRHAAYYDKLTHEFTQLSTFASVKHKVGYLMCRIGIEI